MDDKIEIPQGFEILERVCVKLTADNGKLCIIIKAICKDTNATVWLTGDALVCAVTTADFVRGKLDYNSVLIREFPLEAHTPENVGRWRPLIEDFVENILTRHMERDGFARVHPQWLPKHAYAHLGQEVFDKMCEGCHHILLYADPQIMDFIPKPSGSSVTTQAINGEIRRGDYVIAVDNNDYAYLIGEVVEILKHGTPEHADETDNDTDSVHVNFKAFYYPPSQQNDIAEHFNTLSSPCESMIYDELSLDDVIMAPDMLIRITELGEEKINALVDDYDKAKVYCDGMAKDNK